MWCCLALFGIRHWQHLFFSVLFCFVFNSSKLSWTNRYIFVSPYVYNEWICFALIRCVFRFSLVLLLRHNSIALYRSCYFRISRFVHTWFRHIIISQVISYSFEEAFKLIHIFLCVCGFLFCLYLSGRYKLAVHRSSSIIPLPHRYLWFKCDERQFY